MAEPALRAIVRSPTGACLRIGGIGPAGAWIGRSQDCGVVIDDPARIVSAHHCRIDFADNRFWVTDFSRNGTMLNGSVIGEGKRQPVEPGDNLGLGGFTLALEAPVAAEVADPLATTATGPAWDIDATAPFVAPPRFGGPAPADPPLTAGIGGDQLHDLLDDLIASGPEPGVPSPRPEAPPAEADRRMTLFVPDRPRPANPAVAPFWYGLGVVPPSNGPDDPADFLIELGAAMRTLSEGLGRRSAQDSRATPANPLLDGPAALRQFLATRAPQGPTLDKLVLDALGRLDARDANRRQAMRRALGGALRTMTPRAVEARFGAMIRGWRRATRRAALLDLLVRMEDELVDQAEARFLRDIDATPSAPEREHGR